MDEYIAATWKEDEKDELYFLVSPDTLSSIKRYANNERLILGLSNVCMIKLCKLFVRPGGTLTSNDKKLLNLI